MNVKKLLVPLLVLVAAAVGWAVYQSGGKPKALPAAAGPGSAGPAAPAERGGADALARPTGERLEVVRPAGDGLRGPDGELVSEQEVTPPDVYTGRVLDPFGRAIEGALVRFGDEEPRDPNPAVDFVLDAGARMIDPGRNTGVTDRRGRFEIERGDGFGDEVEITILAPGFRDDPVLHRFVDKAAAEIGDLVVQPGVIVAGYVFDDAGAPVEGAEVRRLDMASAGGQPMQRMLDDLGMNPRSVRGQTRADGSFELPYERAGAISLVVKHEDHLDARWDGVTPDPGSTMSGIEVTIVRAGVIYGSIAGFPEGRRGVLVAAKHIPSEADEGAPKAAEVTTSRWAEMISETLAPAGRDTDKVELDGTFVMRGLQPGGKYEVRAIEKHEFIEVHDLSAPIETYANGSHVTLQYDFGATLDLQVVDARTGAPVEDYDLTASFGGTSARVRLTENSQRPPRKHADGRARLYELRPPADPALLDLRVRSPGYIDGVFDQLSIPQGTIVDAGVLELEPAPVLRFRVLDSLTRQPIRKARVSLLEDGNDNHASTSKTDAAGRCSVAAFDDEVATLVVFARGYPDYRREDYPLEPHDQLREILLVQGGVITATVFDPEGRPVAGANVTCRPKEDADTWRNRTQETTDDEGVATFRELAAGEYALRARRGSGGQGGRGGRRGGGNVQVTVNDITGAQGEAWVDVVVGEAATAEVELAVPEVAELRGVVLLRGEPLPRATVVLGPAEPSPEEELRMEVMRGFGGGGELTQHDGRFVMEDVLLGDYSLRVSHPDLAMGSLHEVVVGPGSNFIEVRVVVTSIEGTVRDQAGQPVAGARVQAGRSTSGDKSASDMQMARYFMGSDADGAVTDAQGYYRIDGVKPGVPVRVQSRADGHADALSNELVLSEGQTLGGVDLVLVESGSVRVRIAPTEERNFGSMVRARFVEEEDRYPDRFEMFRGEEGVLTGLAPGQWRVTIENDRSGSGDREQLVEIKAGEQAEVAFD